MPTRFLSDAEIEWLERFPEEIDERDLARYFALDADDLRFVRRQHSPAGQLGIALQLCSLRWLGFVPDDLTAAPAEAIAVLGAVLDAPPRAISSTRCDRRPAASIALWFASTPGFVPVAGRSSRRSQDG